MNRVGAWSEVGTMRRYLSHPKTGKRDLQALIIAPATSHDEDHHTYLDIKFQNSSKPTLARLVFFLVQLFKEEKKGDRNYKKQKAFKHAIQK
jgi:hypothetical protein